MSIPAQPSPAWTDNVLDPMRQLTDPLADAVVAEAFQQGQADAVNALMRTLIENDDLPSDQLPQGIRDYLATSAQMPAWADPARIQAGRAGVLALWPGDHPEPLLLWAALLLRRGKGRAGSRANNTVVLEPNASRC
jgi:hypothetical protein